MLCRTPGTASPLLGIRVFCTLDPLPCVFLRRSPQILFPADGIEKGGNRNFRLDCFFIRLFELLIAKRLELLKSVFKRFIDYFKRLRSRQIHTGYLEFAYRIH